jgi:hypothetical protein
MKKILLVTISCAVLASSLFAKSNSLLGNIEKLSILMFVYMNLVANMLQEELAGKVD